MEMTNLVTHPFGIGEQLILQLLDKGESVFTIYPSPKDVPMSFLGKINLKYGFSRLDQEFNIEKSLPRQVEHVFHVYEAYSGPFIRIHRANPSATLQLLEWSRRIGAKTFTYISSGDVYGSGEGIVENAAFNPRSFYGITKFEAELFMKFFSRSLNIVTARVFFPFGKSVKEGYIAELYSEIKSGGSIEADYSVVSPTYANDVAGPLIKARGLNKNEIFNICGSPVQVEELVDKIKSVCTGSPKKVSLGKLALTGNNSKVKEALGYSETSLSEALKNSFGT